MGRATRSTLGLLFFSPGFSYEKNERMWFLSLGFQISSDLTAHVSLWVKSLSKVESNFFLFFFDTHFLTTTVLCKPGTLLRTNTCISSEQNGKTFLNKKSRHNIKYGVLGFEWFFFFSVFRQSCGKKFSVIRLSYTFVYNWSLLKKVMPSHWKIMENNFWVGENWSWA